MKTMGHVHYATPAGKVGQTNNTYRTVGEATAWELLLVQADNLREQWVDQVVEVFNTLIPDSQEIAPPEHRQSRYRRRR